MKIVKLTSFFHPVKGGMENHLYYERLELLKLGKNVTAIFHILRFAKEIFGLDYDILHIHSYRQFHNLGVFMAKLRGKKVILSTHWPEYPKEIRGSFLHLMTKLIDYTIGPVILKSI